MSFDEKALSRDHLNLEAPTLDFKMRKILRVLLRWFPVQTADDHDIARPPKQSARDFFGNLGVISAAVEKCGNGL